MSESNPNVSKITLARNKAKRDASYQLFALVFPLIILTFLLLYLSGINANYLTIWGDNLALPAISYLAINLIQWDQYGPNADSRSFSRNSWLFPIALVLMILTPTFYGFSYLFEYSDSMGIEPRKWMLYLAVLLTIVISWNFSFRIHLAIHQNYAVTYGKVDPVEDSARTVAEISEGLVD